MQVTVLHEIQVIDGSDPGKSRVPLAEGTYEIEEMANPYGYSYSRWWAIKGTKRGFTKGAWVEHQEKGDVALKAG